MKQLVKKEKGFTIIEVVLVLAIAGLIFMVVFLAVPGLQRSQRDTQRKQDLGRLVSTITSYQGNNKGVIPAQATVYNAGTPNGAIYQELVSGGSAFSDPGSHNPYDVRAVAASGAGFSSVNGALTQPGFIVIAINASCNEPSTAATPFVANSGNANASFAVAMQMEGSVYCQNG
jgi:prepilin-type N-terminal cleavage/methylation domain-containing protein